MPTPSSIAARPSILLAALGAFALVLALVFFAYTVQAQGQEVTPTSAATGEDPPAQPTNLQVEAEHDSVSLTWEASSDQTVTHYAVLRRDRDTDALGVFQVIDGNAGPGTSYTDRSVSAQGSYVYRVKAVSPTGVSQWSAYAKADTPAAPEPTPTPTPTPEATPEDLAPSGLGVNLVENRVTLSWEAPANDAGSVTGYEVLRRRPKEGENALQTLVADTGSAAATYVDATANEPGVRYTYRVKALRGSDVSQWSNFAFIDLDQDYTPPEPEPASEPDPAAPANLTAEIVDDGVALSWDAPAQDAESVTEYEVSGEGTKAGKPHAVKTLIDSVATAWTDRTDKETGVSYTYRVRAVRDGEKSGWSNAARVDLPGKESPNPEDDPPVALPQVVVVGTALVKNTGQAANATADALDTAYPTAAQEFTTGTGVRGWRLSSIDVSFDTISDTSTAGSELTVTLNEAMTQAGLFGSYEVPGNVLCTLTDPASFSASGVHTFDAPSRDQCPILSASTDYFVVLARANTNTGTISYNSTSGDDEDSGAATGWSIGDSGHYFNSETDVWVLFSGSMQIEVRGVAEADIEVWSTTMTAEHFSGDVIRGYAGSQFPISYGSIADDDFVYHGITYTVVALAQNRSSNTLALHLERPTGQKVHRDLTTSGLYLGLGGAYLSFGDATQETSDDAGVTLYAYTWSGLNSVFTWADGEAVAVSLEQATTTLNIYNVTDQTAAPGRLDSDNAHDELSYANFRITRDGGDELFDRWHNSNRGVTVELIFTYGDGTGNPTRSHRGLVGYNRLDLIEEFIWDLRSVIHSATSGPLTIELVPLEGEPYTVGTSNSICIVLYQGNSVLGENCG